MEDEMKKIVICKYCGKPEYYGEMRWLSGRCFCRSCYKSQWQDENHKLYTWNDLDGKRPTMLDYKKKYIKDSTELSGGHLW
jgi:late competence protein required for DNA uptake (superfamily II DNA/RNA helicase)